MDIARCSAMGVEKCRFKLSDAFVQLFRIGEDKSLSLHTCKVAIGADQGTASPSTFLSAYNH